MVLQRALREVLGGVVVLMVDVRLADGREVQSLLAGLLEGREVGVVAHALVDLVADRVRRGVGVRPPQRIDDPAVVGPGLEHHRWAAAAPHLDPHEHRHIVEPGMLVHERTGAQQVDLLGVRDEDDHVVAKGGPGAQCTHRLQDGDHAGAVVGRAQRDFVAVVVGGDEDGRTARLRAGGCAPGCCERSLR